MLSMCPWISTAGAFFAFQQVGEFLQRRLRLELAQRRAIEIEVQARDAHAALLGEHRRPVLGADVGDGDLYGPSGSSVTRA